MEITCAFSACQGVETITKAHPLYQLITKQLLQFTYVHVDVAWYTSIKHQGRLYEVGRYALWTRTHNGTKTEVLCRVESTGQCEQVSYWCKVKYSCD
jgi:hypothetical protein